MNKTVSILYGGARSRRAQSDPSPGGVLLRSSLPALLVTTLLGCGDSFVGNTGAPGSIAAPSAVASGDATSTPGIGAASASTGGTCDAQAVLDPGPLFSRRLNRTEYNNTVRDLLGIEGDPSATFPGEELAFNFDNNAEALSVSPLLAEEYIRVAESLASSTALDLGKLVPCDGAAGESCARTFLDGFGTKAFRRPLEADEADAYMSLFRLGAASGFESGIRLMLDGILQSAPFLYRLEVSRPDVTTGLVKPSSYEMASRLSYFLWKTMPDDALFDAAASDLLQTPEQIEGQVRRMLADDRTRQMIGDFHSQWLSLRDIDGLEKSPDIYPEFNASIARDMQEEARRFIDEVLYTEKDASRFFDADYTFVNANLAKFYGIDGVSGEDFQKVTLNDQPRAGVLTLGGILSTLAKPNQTNPIIRGKYVRVQMLCNDMPDPPAGINIQVPDLDPGLTTRERFREHSGNPACAGCHTMMDPIGLAFENYDAVGRYREDENGLPIDVSGNVQGTDVEGAFSGARELGDKLAQSADAKTCLVKNWFRYAYGRNDGEGAQDSCVLERLNAAFAGANYDVTELIVALTRGDAFSHRRTGDAL